VAHFFNGAIALNEHALEAAHAAPLWAKWSATIAMLIGLGIAYYMYIRAPETPRQLADTNPGLYRFLLNKWYFDELYDTIFVRPARWIGTAIWRGFDDWLIDQTVVEGLGNRVKDVTARVVRLQSGYLYHYAFAMLIGIAALLTWAIASGGLLG
jgi:NADH-quinone oxidoreductase subunit L